VVASHSWWQRRFGGDASAIGKTITIGETSYTIIGVTPRDFFGTSVGDSPDIWVPLSMEEQLPPHFKGLSKQNVQSLYLIGAVKDNVSVEQAGAEINLLFQTDPARVRRSAASEEQLQNIQQARIGSHPQAGSLRAAKENSLCRSRF